MLTHVFVNFRKAYISAEIAFHSVTLLYSSLVVRSIYFGIVPLVFFSNEHSSQVFTWRDMARRQEIGNPSVPVNLRVINNIIERNEQQYLLLSTYPLNYFHTKLEEITSGNTIKEEIFLSSNWLVITQKKLNSIRIHGNNFKRI